MFCFNRPRDVPITNGCKKWSPESMRHEKRGPRLSTNTRGGCSEIQDILLGTSSSPCSRSLEATPHVVRNTVVENFLPKSLFMDTISSLAHCQPHAGTPIPGNPSQAVRTLAKGSPAVSVRNATGRYIQQDVLYQMTYNYFTHSAAFLLVNTK